MVLILVVWATATLDEWHSTQLLSPPPPPAYISCAFMAISCRHAPCLQHVVQGGRPVQILDPNRVRKILGVWRGGGGLVGQLVSRRGPQGGGGAKYIPQNDPHGALIILNIHNWGKRIFRKFCTLAQAPISQGLTRRSGRGSNFFLCFSPILQFSTKF